MGSNQDSSLAKTVEGYMTIPQASKYLNKCDKTVKSYITGGILRATRFRGMGKRWWIKEEDVQALKEMQGQRLRTVDIYELLRTVKIRLHSIDHKLNFLMRVSGLDVSALRDAPVETLIQIYDEASDYLELNAAEVTVEQMEKWSHIFLQFTELEFDRMVGPTQDTSPWKPLHQLCVHWMRSLRRRKGFPSSQRMQEVYRILEKGRKSLGQAIVVFNESRAGEIGPIKVKQIAPFGLTEDSLDRYIAAEASKRRTT